MSTSNKEKKDKLHKVKSSKDKRKENKTFLKTIKSNYQDIEFLESRVEAEAEAESTHPPVENKTAPTTGKESTLAELAAQVKDCRPEFAGLNTDAILNLLRGVPLPVARRAVAEFCRDELNALQPSNKPLKLLGGYLRTARTAPQFTGVQNVTDTVQRANDIAQARTEYAAVETWRTDPPKWAKPGDADKKQREILAGIAAKYGPDAAADVRKPKEEL